MMKDPLFVREIINGLRIRNTRIEWVNMRGRADISEKKNQADFFLVPRPINFPFLKEV